MDRAKTICSPAIPPRFAHWKTLLLFSIVIWVLSFFILDETREVIAAVGWILITISLGWATSLPPFVLGSFPLSPWVIATFLCLLIYQITDDTNPTLAFKVWPLIAAVFLAVVEWFKTRDPENSPPILSRQILVIIILIHFLLSCWIEIYILVYQQMENNPEFNPEITRPRSAFLRPAPFLPKAENHHFLKPDEEFPQIF